MINRSNYEQYFLDFHEAALDAALTKELFLFLEENPDLKEEFHGFVNLRLEPELDITFSNKSSLHKSSITKFNYLAQLVAYVENDLEDTTRSSVEKFVSEHAEAATELEILKKARIPIDNLIVFKDKNSLKKSAKVINIRVKVYRATAIAASLVLLLLSYYIFTETNEPSRMVQQKINTEEPVMVEASSSINASLAESSASETAPLISDVDLAAEKRLNKKISANNRHNLKLNHALENHDSDKGELLITKEQQLALEENKIEDQKIFLKSEHFIIADNTFPALISSDLRISVFSLEELAEFEQMKIEQTNSGNTNAWDLVETGVEKLGKIAGTKMELDRHHDHIANATTYALEVGKFSISRTNVK